MEILWNTHVYNRKVLLKSLKKEKFTNKNGSHSALNIFTEYSMTDPGDLADTIDLNSEYQENKNSSAPTFHYILDDVVTVETDTDS